MIMAKTPKSKKNKRKTSSFFVGIFKVISVLYLFLLLTAFSARFISPDTFWPIAFIGISFPYLYIFSFVLLFFWLIIHRKFSLFVFVVQLICMPLFLKFFNIFSVSHKNETQNASHIKVLSFNVRTFNIRTGNKKIDIVASRDEMFAFIKEQNADIICLQEVYSDMSHKFRTIDTLSEIQKASDEHSHYTFKRKNQLYGISTLSAFPIVNKGTLSFPMSSKNPCIYTDIAVGQDTIRVYNAHFASIGISPEDFAFIENISSLNFDDNEQPELDESFRKIARRLKKAFICRAQQIRIIADHISVSPYPVVLCTDLNDTPSSYAYYKLTRHLNDAFLASGKGIGETYNGKLPYFRIDYVFYSDLFVASGFRTHNIKLSDHFPVTTDLYLTRD